MTQTLGQRPATPETYLDWAYASTTCLLVVTGAARSRFLDHLGDEPMAIDDRAAAAGLNAERLGRLVRFLASQDFLTIGADGRVAHTAASRLLRSDHPARCARRS
jgi:C-methyltransferase